MTSRADHLAIVWLAVVLTAGTCVTAQASPKAAPPSPAGPTAVILLPSGQQPGLLLAADLLAEALGKSKDLLVVDRQQIDRVLREQALEGPVRPAVAWNVLVRLRGELGEKAEFALECIDLSSGNIRSSSRFPLDPQAAEGKLAEMVALCRQGALAAASRQRLRVRLLGIGGSRRNPRMESMADELDVILRQSIGESTKAEAVEHLEALTAKEESLLLYLGLSRLGQGLRFVPQADATLQAELLEEDAEGKDFPQTPLVVRFRLDRDGAGQWTEFRGTVSQWAGLAGRLTAELARQLGEAEVQPLADRAAEMLTRRRQAEAEYQAILAEGRQNEWDYQRLAAVAKIDPTYEPAAYTLIETLALRRSADKPLRDQAVLEAWRYLQRFPNAPEGGWKRGRSGSVYWLAAVAMSKGTWQDGVLSWPDGPPAHEVLRFMVDKAFRCDADDYPIGASYLVRYAYQAMARAGVPLEDRRQWLDELVARSDRIRAAVRGNSSKVESLRYVLAWACKAAAQEGDTDRARALVKEFMAAGKLSSNSPAVYAALDAVRRIGDGRLLRQFDAWRGRSLSALRPVGLTRSWDYPRTYADSAAGPACRELTVGTPLLGQQGWLLAACSVSRGKSLDPVRKGIVERLSRLRLELRKLDQDGAPLEETRGLEIPEAPGDLAVTCAVWCGGRLVLGTAKSGLIVGRPDRQQWQRFTPQQGLPGRCVTNIFPIDNKQLLCFSSGATGWAARAIFLFDLDTGTVTLLARSPFTGSMPDVFRVDCLWQHEGKWIGLNAAGLVTDMLSPARAMVAMAPAAARGWKNACCSNSRNPGWSGPMAVTPGRRWLLTSTGLHELEPTGRAIRGFWNIGLAMASAVPDSTTGMLVPSSMPEELKNDPRDRRVYPYWYLVASGEYLFLAAQDKFLCYDPRDDTWYGPLPVRWWRYADPVGTPAGVYLPGKPMKFMATADFLAAARSAGRVATTAQIDEMRRQRLCQEGPVALARLELQLHNFDQCRRLLDGALEANPADADALYLMAVLHDSPCLDRPTEALKYLAVLAKLADNPQAVYTGLREQLPILRRLRRWQEVIAVGQQLLESFDLEPRRRDEVNRAIDEARTRKAEAERYRLPRTRQGPATNEAS